jgi:UDP-N-acetylglucosamine diphosphorylase/glucosamine-1-phosphate N-acetyltransferase
MEFILKDFNEWSTLRPLTLTRTVADIRIGILTIREKWNLYLSTEVKISTEFYLQPLYPAPATGINIIIRSSVLPDKNLVKAIQSLELNSSLWKGDIILAYHSDGKQEISSLKKTEYDNEIMNIQFPWDIFSQNKKALELDFEVLTEGKKSQKISESNKIIGKGKIFLAEGAKCEASYLNTNDGPIYIGKNAEVMEGSMIRGPFSLGDDSQLKMGTKIYGATTIGPHCKVGGEVTNSVIFGFSNKAHDGFLGNSVIGEWCNLGADTNNSNLKNNYGIVKVWSYDAKNYFSTGLQFCGLIMGDHSKSGINTMFNTGTVVGVSANIYGGGFPDKFIPSYSWGGAAGFIPFEWDKAMEVAERVMERRSLKLSPEMKKVLQHLYQEQ